MGGLSPTGVRRLLELVGHANGLGDLDAFRTGVLDALLDAVPSLYASYNEVRGSAVWALSRPALSTDDVERWARLADEHPVLDHMRRTRDGRPRRISQHLDAAALRRTALHREFYGPLGIDSQVAFTLPSASPLVVGVALSRGAEDFSDDEVTLLALARPHLIQAYRAAQHATDRERLLVAMTRGVESEGRSAVVATRDGVVVHAGAEARAVLGVEVGGRLATELRSAVAEHRRPGAGTAPRRIGPAHDRVRVLPGTSEDGLDVLVVERADGGLTVERLRALGLTSREAEVLRLLALGATGPATATAMEISPRTVSKHLQAVYEKLGVHSRSAASRTAWAAVDDGISGPTPP